MKPALYLFAATLVAANLFGQDIQLPAPQKSGGMPLMDALAKRSTTRAFDSKDLSLQQMSSLLWAAFGINRPDGKRTAPSAHNWREIDIYVTFPNGAYVYNAEAHRLDPVSSQDLRSAAGMQSFVNTAPLNLVYVADQKKTGNAPIELSAAGAGFIGQNVYLFCASEGLASVFRAGFKGPELTKAFNLRPEQKILFAQTVGWPK